MIHKTNSTMIFWLLFGFFLIFIGFLSIFTGFVQIISADDVFFLVQIEDMFFAESVSKDAIVLSAVLRIMIGFLFIVLGNSFIFRGGFVSFCAHPRMSDFTNRRSFRDL